MSKKTCGECIYFMKTEYYDMCAMYASSIEKNDVLCKYFTPKVITKGDKIRHGGNRALAEFHQKPMCSVCIYKNAAVCKAPNGKMANCTDGIEAWLNTPAESEGKNDR